MNISITEHSVRTELVTLAKSLFDRGYTHGSSGNISVRLADDTIITTPTNSCFGLLDPERLSKITLAGQHISGDKPTKEVPMHLAFYRSRPDCYAVVHLHSVYLTALSCLQALDHDNCLPAISPYFFMKVGKLPLLPYFKPGAEAIAQAILNYAPTHKAVLLANHGPVVTGKSLSDAVFNMEEVENAAKLFFLLQGCKYNELSLQQITELLAPH